MKIKNIVSLSVLIALMAQSTTIYANEKQLNDINSHWAESYITSFVNKGYIGGYEDNTFKPNNSITRAEFVKVVNKIFRFTNSQLETFTDIDKDDWFYSDICIAIKNGYISGYSDNTFKPNKKISREEASAIITNIKKNKDSNLDKLIKYKDANKVASWSMSSVEGILEAGYMGGYDDMTFRPQNDITRAEAVVTLARVQSGEKSVPASILDVLYISQYPDLPLGCEATSLTQLLNYKGVNVDKVKIAKEMPYSPSKDPSLGFVGSPFQNQKGVFQTIYPQALIKTAQKYRPSSYYEEGTPIETLERELRNGNPSVVWVTLGFNTPKMGYWYEGTKDQMWVTQNLHVVALTGVDSDEFYITDPAKGKYKVKKSTFKSIYDTVGKKSLIVK